YSVPVLPAGRADTRTGAVREKGRAGEGVVLITYVVRFPWEEFEKIGKVFTNEVPCAFGVSPHSPLKGCAAGRGNRVAAPRPGRIPSERDEHAGGRESGRCGGAHPRRARSRAGGRAHRCGPVHRLRDTGLPGPGLAAPD